MTATGFLMATRGTGINTESEPVTYTITNGVLTLDLDDGDRLILNFDDLLAAAVDTHDPHIRQEAA